MDFMLNKKNGTMKTKVLITGIFMLIAGMMTAQQQNQAGKTGISKEQMQERIGKSVSNKIKNAEIKETEEAIAILKETQAVIADLAQNKNDEAEKKLAEVIGKLEILLAQKPELSLIPVDANVEMKDAVTDVSTVRTIMDHVKKAIEQGYYQEAKQVLNDLSSELVIKTAYLPMATYPGAMKLAAKLMHEGKNREAAAVLVNALNTLIIGEEIIPLPVLRAEEYIKEAVKVLNNEKAFKENKETLLALLDAASYQLDLAQAMGYGKKDKEYKDLHQAIVRLKDYVNKGREKKTGKALKDLSLELKKFKERLFYKKQK